MDIDEIHALSIDPHYSNELVEYYRLRNYLTITHTDKKGRILLKLNTANKLNSTETKQAIRDLLALYKTLNGSRYTGCKCERGIYKMLHNIKDFFTKMGIQIK